MGKSAKHAPASGCGHPVLAAFAKAFVEMVDAPAPVDAARILADMSKSWKNPAKRRRALAARIALLGETSLATEETALPAEEISPEPEPEEPAAAPARAPRAKVKALPPQISRKETASLLAQFDQPDLSEFDSAASVETGSQYEKMQPEQGAASHRWLRDLPDSNSSQGNSWSGNFGDGTEGNFLNERSLENDDDMKLTRKKDTMTDLSLSILTGVFKKTPDGPDQPPQDITAEDRAETDPAPRKSAATPDLASLFGEMAGDDETATENAPMPEAPSSLLSEDKREPSAGTTIPTDAILRESEDPLSTHKAAARIVDNARASQFRTGLELEDDTPEDTPEDTGTKP